MASMKNICVHIILAVFVFIDSGWAQAKNTEKDLPITSINLLASKINKNDINLFSIDCENAKYGDHKIFCTSFNISITDKLTAKEKKGEDLQAAIKELREGAGISDLCADEAVTMMEQAFSLYDRVNSGEEVLSSGKIITKTMLDDYFARLASRADFYQLDNVLEIFRNIRALCKGNAAGLRKALEASVIRAFENEKKGAGARFYPSRGKTEYKKDFETGAFYYERTWKNECFILYQRDEIRFDKAMLRFELALVAEYEEITKVIDVLRSDSKCLERKEDYSKKIIWRAGQRLELPKHWKFLDILD
ncbi:hypothetical protein OAN80_04505 [Alphaproteobacteria bacterium]|nr:hypothetical protein [Alphaproteobacteria bacterium]